MALSIREAASEVGVSKSTVLRAIQRGRLSAARDDDGNYNIEPSELFRVYAPRTEVRPARRDRVHRPMRWLRHRCCGHASRDSMHRSRCCASWSRRRTGGLREPRQSPNSLQRHADAAQKQTEAALKHVEAVQLLLADQRPKRRGWLGWRAA